MVVRLKVELSTIPKRRRIKMGTRALIIFKDVKYKKDEKTEEYVRDEMEEIVVLYSQYDGYLQGLGKDIAEFLYGGTLVNGYGFGVKEKQFNGMGDLSQRLAASFGTEVGTYYLCKAGTRDCGEEFRYYIYPDADEKTIRIRVEGGEMTAFGMAGSQKAWRTIFDGSLEEFCNMLEKQDDLGDGPLVLDKTK
jgi:hypothetical protein